MTFKEFRESGINYDEAYKKAMAEAKTKEAGLQKALFRCYRNYMGFRIIAGLRESKVASKPLHYKAVNDFVSSFNTDDSRFFMSTESYTYLGKNTKLQTYVKSINGGYDPFYLMERREDNTMDWDGMDRCTANIVNPSDIESLYRKQIRINEEYKKAVEKLKDGYTAERRSMPWLIDAIHVAIK